MITEEMTQRVRAVENRREYWRLEYEGGRGEQRDSKGKERGERREGRRRKRRTQM